MNKELIDKLKEKKVCEMWKKDLTIQEEYRNTVRTCGDATWTAKVLLEINLVLDQKKDIFKYVSGKKKTWENVGPLLNEVGPLVTGVEKENILNAFFALVLMIRLIHKNPRPWR